MKSLLLIATSALCVLLAAAVPLPSESAAKELEIVQIPLQGNKVSAGRSSGRHIRTCKPQIRRAAQSSVIESSRSRVEATITRSARGEENDDVDGG